MTKRGAVFTVSGIAVLGAACLAFVRVCPPAATCLRSMVQVGVWLSMDGRVSWALIGLVLTAWMVRTVFLLRGTEQAVRRLATCEVPSRMRAGQVRIGAARLVCLKADRESAFCSGTWRPTIFIGETLADRLSPDELDAVLLHELDHASGYEPMRRAARQAAADILFFAPIVRWWAQRRTVQVELHADRAALERVGPRAVAAALWTLGGSVPSGVAAFVGSAGPRVAQLLGDSIAQPGPPPRLVAASLVGTYVALQVLACAAATFLYPR